jgi:hypothetical protein
VLNIPVVDGRPYHELGSIVDQFDREHDVERVSVQTLTIDSESLENVGFIKIDVEQHEREVMRGAASTIERDRPILLSEVTPLLYDEPLPETFRFLLEQGYRGYFSFGGRRYDFADFRPGQHANPSQFGRSFMGTNVVFVPAEKIGERVKRALRLA